MKRLSIADIKTTEILSIEEKRNINGGLDRFYPDGDCFEVSYLDMDNSSSLNGPLWKRVSSYEEARNAASMLEIDRNNSDITISNC